MIVARLWLEGLLQAQTVLRDCELDDLLGRKNPVFFQKQKDLSVRFINYTFGKSLEFTKLTEDRAGQSLTIYCLRHT